jgi:HlyD family secretion protein
MKRLALGIGMVLPIAFAIRADDISQTARRPQQEPGVPGSRAQVVRATGTVEPLEVVDVSARVAGTIQKLWVDFGAKVKRGDVLAELDKRTYEVVVFQARADLQQVEASVRLAKAKVILAEQEVKRTTEAAVRQNESIQCAKAGLDVARAAVVLEEARAGQAKAALERANLDLSYCTICSPTDGVILDRRCNVGQSVTANAASPGLFLVGANLEKIQVWASVSEKDIVRIAKGQRAHFTVDAYPKEKFEGQVAQIRLNAALTKDAVTYTVVLSTDNSNGKLLPYLTVQVSIDVAPEDDK